MKAVNVHIILTVQCSFYHKSNSLCIVLDSPWLSLNCVLDKLPFSLFQIIFKGRKYMMAAMCAFCFLLSLPHLSKGGSYLTEIADVSLFGLLFVIILLAIPPLAIAYGK